MANTNKSTRSTKRRSSAGDAPRESTVIQPYGAANRRGRQVHGAAVTAPSAMEHREGAVAARERTAGSREATVDRREKTSAIRETALQAREDVAGATSALEQLVSQMREANEHLVVGTVQAQTMTENATEANHLKDEFLATVSHELRTPLNAVLGWARMLSSMQLPPLRARHGLATIERNASALAHIIDDLLDVSRIAEGTLHVSPQRVDLVEITRAAVETVQPLADEKNVRLIASPDASDEMPVNADASRLEQIIWNLLANAIKFTPAGGTVHVFIEPSSDHMEIRVVDTGQGISSEFLPHVFERFRQADNTATRRHSGLGLGLSIVRQLVELHGGTVHAASEGEGHGATFTVRLPRIDGDGPVDHQAALGDRRVVTSTRSPTARHLTLEGVGVLVVDDSADGRALASLLLSQAGATITTVATAQEALRAIELAPPDVLVSDIGLPDEDGYVLIQRIRELETMRGGFLPAIALTGYARADDRARVMAAGFQAHMTKPIDLGKLTATIAAIAATHRAAGS